MWDEFQEDLYFVKEHFVVCDWSKDFFYLGAGLCSSFLCFLVAAADRYMT